MGPRTIARLTLTALVLTGCANATSIAPGDGIEHPTGAGQPILMITYDGGFVPAEYLFTRMPSFALYGDGTLVLQGAQMEIYPGPALPAQVARTIDEAGIQAILRAALDAGLDRDGDYSDMGQMGITDVGTTRFQLSADGTTHVVTAYALGLEGEQQPGQPDDVWQMRRSLVRLQERLGVLDWLPGGSLGDEHPFEAASARLLVAPYRPDEELPQAPVAWPLPRGLATFGEPADMLGDAWRCGVIEGEDWAAVHDLATSANTLTPWTSDGRRSTIVFRPLLPDETGCVEP
jgi:hypothetical protein